MFKHYLKIALRNITRRKAYSAITVSGLAIGMACCILILVHVLTELSYDRYHENASRIYRLGANLTLGGTPNAIASTNAPPARVLPDEYPEVLTAARVQPVPKVPVRFDDVQFFEERILFADATIFDVFSFRMVRGNPELALGDPYSIVITEGVAEKYFGEEDPIGRVLKINNQENYSVTGIIRDVPANSHFVFDMLCSYETLYSRDRETLESWSSSFRNYTYLLLHESADYQELEAKFPALVEKYVGDEFESFGASVAYFLQPLTKIHLHSNLRHELAPNSDISYVYIYSAVAFSILLIACFNFMNLATALASARALEIAVRKVLGADRRELIKQFLSESLLISLVSLAIALSLVHLALPRIGNLLAADSIAKAEGVAAMAERSFSIDYFSTPWFIPAFLGLAILVAVGAGTYPALFLASFHPARIMSGGWKIGSGAVNFSRVLVALQLIIAVVLIISTGTVLRQLSFMQDIKLGFEKDNVVILPILDEKVRGSLPSIKEELRRHPGVISVGASSHVPGQRPSGGAYAPEGYPEGQTEMMDWMAVDADYAKTLGMTVVAGRCFSADFPADPAESVMINEAAARKFGWEDPIGKTIRPASVEEKRTVVGVVGDFHFSSPHRVIGPLFITNNLEPVRSLFVRVVSEDLPGTIDFLRRKWSDIDPDRPFQYSFLDVSYDQQYEAEENLSRLLACFAGLAIFVSCLGLSGMVSFLVSRRTREIGIRKVLGSSVGGIVLLLNRELLILCFVSFLVACPIAYFVMLKWIGLFPYRTDLNPLLFVGAGFLMLMIALATASIQSIKAAMANPIHALRGE